MLIGGKLCLYILSAKSNLGFYNAKYNVKDGEDWINSSLDAFLVCAANFSRETKEEEVKELVKACYLQSAPVRKQILDDRNRTYQTLLYPNKSVQFHGGEKIKPKGEKPVTGLFHPVEQPPAELDDDQKIRCQVAGCGSKFQSYHAAKTHHKKKHEGIVYREPEKVIDPVTKHLGDQKLRVDKVQCRMCNTLYLRSKIKMHIHMNHREVTVDIQDRKCMLRGWWQADIKSQIFKPVCLKAGVILPKYMLPKDEDMDTDPLDITDDGIDDVTKNMTDSNEEASIHDSSLDTDPDLTNVQDNDGEVCSGGDDLTKDDDAGSNDSRNNHGTSLDNASVHKEHALGEYLTKWKGHVQKGEEMIENEENRGKENEDIDAKSNYSGRNQGTSLDNASVEEHVLEEPITKRRKDAHNEKEMIENAETRNKDKVEFFQFLTGKNVEKFNNSGHDRTLSMADWKPEEYDHSPITFKDHTVERIMQTHEVSECNNSSEEIDKEEEKEQKEK